MALSARVYLMRRCWSWVGLDALQGLFQPGSSCEMGRSPAHLTVPSAHFPWVELQLFQGNNLAQPAQMLNQIETHSYLWYSLSKISFNKLFPSIYTSSSLGGFLLPLSVPG